MRVIMAIDVTEAERYVMAKYFAPAGVGADKSRVRATRAQVRRFTRAALASAVRDYACELPARGRAVARRLAESVPIQETLPPPREQQRSLIWQ